MRRPANVLIDKNFVAKITDFNYTVGAKRTLLWTAPELLFRSVQPIQPPLSDRSASQAHSIGAATAASDVYSFGVVLYECLSRREPFQGEDPTAAAAGIAAGKARLPTPEGCSAELAVLLGECLNFEPALRPLFIEIERRLEALEPTCVTSAAFSAADTPSVSMLQKLRWRSSTAGSGPGSPASLEVIARAVSKQFTSLRSWRICHEKSIRQRALQMLTMELGWESPNFGL